MVVSQPGSHPTQNNQGSVRTQATLWEAIKATVCGNIINYTFDLKRKRTTQVADLETRALDVETQHLLTDNPATLHDMLHTQSLIKQTLTEEAKAANSKPYLPMG